MQAVLQLQSYIYFILHILSLENGLQEIACGCEYYSICIKYDARGG